MIVPFGPPESDLRRSLRAPTTGAAALVALDCAGTRQIRFEAVAGFPLKDMAMPGGFVRGQTVPPDAPLGGCDIGEKSA